MPETKLDKAKKLLEEYNNPATPDSRIDEIIETLYKMGYIIRPDAGAWKLMDRKTRVFVA